MNPYQRYAEANILSETSERLVVALYQYAVEAVSKADACNQSADHFGRGQAINQALDAIAELAGALDDRIEISARLRDLYGYCQMRLVEAHVEQSSTKLVEVHGLLDTLLGAWREVAAVSNTKTAEAGPYSEAGTELAGAVVSPVAVPAFASYGRF